jgi:hypothetical protein
MKTKEDVGYHVLFLAGTLKRPSRRMPIDAHREVGTLLKDVLSMRPRLKCRRPELRPFAKIESIRCMLDDWAEREYSRAEMNDETFFGLYYSGGYEWTLTHPEWTAGQMLHRVREILVEHYSAESRSFQGLLKKLDSAIQGAPQ